MFLGIAIAILVLWIVIRIFFKVTKWVLYLLFFAAVGMAAVHFLRVA